METSCIRELIETENHRIISTGGGLPVREENHALLKELGRVYYLKVTPAVVCERLKGDTTRPLLQGADPQGKVKNLMAIRQPFYEKCADYVIEVSGKNFEEIIEEIVKKENSRL